MFDKKLSIQIRQGDVLIEYIDELPPGLVEIPIDAKRGVVLAEGEVTGHSHRVPRRHASGAAQLRSEADARFMRVTAPVPLRHEEHKTVCALCADPAPLATHRLDGAFAREAYRCTPHAQAESGAVVALSEPGATDLPRGVARITIHGEYQPGELRGRDVED